MFSRSGDFFKPRLKIEYGRPEEVFCGSPIEKIAKSFQRGEKPQE